MNGHHLLSSRTLPQVPERLDRVFVMVATRREPFALHWDAREQLLAQARRDIEHETRRALDELRKEVADLTVAATEKITRKSLDEEDHRRLIEEALSEVDFSELAPTAPESSEGNGN